LKVTVPDKKKEKKVKEKTSKGKRVKLSLYPLSFDEAISALIAKPKNKRKNTKI
jgi:hypothetical protein